MFDRLEDILIHFEELQAELSSPHVTEDPARFRKLMKEQADLTPLVETYSEYKAAKQDVEDSLLLLEEESDEEMRELAKEELAQAKASLDGLEQELKILLIPKDPMDEKNVIIEIRAGAGGDEAALFAAELYRMYAKYAEGRRWKIEMMDLYDYVVENDTVETACDKIKAIVVAEHCRRERVAKRYLKMLEVE